MNFYSHPMAKTRMRRWRILNQKSCKNCSKAHCRKFQEHHQTFDDSPPMWIQFQNVTALWTANDASRIFWNWKKVHDRRYDWFGKSNDASDDFGRSSNIDYIQWKVELCRTRAISVNSAKHCIQRNIRCWIDSSVCLGTRSTVAAVWRSDVEARPDND